MLHTVQAFLTAYCFSPLFQQALPLGDGHGIGVFRRRRHGWCLGPGRAREQRRVPPRRVVSVQPTDFIRYPSTTPLNIHSRTQRHTVRLKSSPTELAQGTNVRNTSSIRINTRRVPEPIYNVATPRVSLLPIMVATPPDAGRNRLFG